MGGGYSVECQLIVAYADGSTRAVVSGEGLAWWGVGHRATWSPDAAKIAFANGMGEVMVVTIASLGLVNLTNHPAFDHSPAWSPDGARIVFQSDRDGAEELYVVNADGSNVVRLTYGVGVYNGGHPTWSPDGRRIAFTCDGIGNSDICAINADGTGFTRLASDPNSHDYDPDWSPDGARIAFASSRYQSDYNASIAIMNADGTGVTLLPNAVGGEVDWSPDGSRFMFTQAQSACESYGGCERFIYVINVDGTAREQVPLYGHGAVWAPVSPPLPPSQPDQPPIEAITVGCSRLA